MKLYLKGKKSYLFAGLAIAYGLWGVAAGEMTMVEAVDYLLAGGALAAVRDAIG